MLRNRMTWMAAALGVVAIGMVGCGKGQGSDKGSASINAAKMLSTADVSSVTVTITGGIPTPLTVPLVGQGTQYGALVSDLPVGTNYVFTASAKDASSTELYHGAATNVTITKNQTAAVIIDMNQVAPGVAISNEAPVIDSLTATSLLVSQTDTVTIKASAHDPDAGQTAAMGWAWAVTCGSISAPTNTVGTDSVDGTSMVTFTAPAADGPCSVNVTVTDANGVLKNVASLTIQVGSAAATGSAKITANLDTYPVITGLNGTPVPLMKGQPTTLTVTASDADGDALNYLWTVGPNADNSGTCVGTFGSATAATTTFTLASTSTMSECTFLVRVDDGNFPDNTPKGGVITNHLSLPVSGPAVVGGPVFGYDYQSLTTIKGGDVVGLAIVANQGCTGTLSLVWTASDSTALTPTTPAALGLDGTVFTGAVTYTAQPGAEDGSVVTVTVAATCSTSGASTSHVFTLVPLNSVCNGQPDGTNCTATAGAANKCVQAASCLAGVCHVDTQVTCDPNAADQCHSNACVPATGLCALAPKADNTTCNDSSACTSGDVCTAGVCGGTAKVCPAGNACQVATCNATSGACGLGNVADGTTCNDNSLCTTGDVCTAGTCGGTAVSCNPGFVCTPATGSCDPKICLAPGFGTQSDPLLSGLTSAADGTLWSTGSIYNPFNFGAGTVSSTSSSDAYLNKLNPATGLATQSFTFGYVGGADQTGNLVAATQNGNVLVAGVYVTEIDFTPSVVAATGGTDNVDFLSKSSLAIGAPMNYFVVASAASVMPEITPIKAHNVDLGTGAFLASASNPANNLVALCGKTGRSPGLYGTGTTNTGLLTGTATAFGGSTDIVVAVVDATTGAVVWGKMFGGAGDQQCQSVAIDAAGNVYIAGNYNGTLSFGTGFDLPTVATSTTLGLPYVAKLNNTGTVVAAKTWGAAAISDVLGIAVDSSSNVVIAGDVGVGVNADFGAPVGILNSTGKTDGFVVKLNSSLASAMWGFTFGDAAFDQAVLSLALSSSGDVFMGGAFTGTLTGLGGLASNGNTSTDAFTVQLSGATGAVLCAQSYGDAAGNQNAAYLTVATAASNKVTFGGNFSGTMTLGSLTGSHVTLTAASNSGYVAGLVP